MDTVTTFYSIIPSGQILDKVSGQKIYKIHDLPAEDKPREKLWKYGPAVLSVRELLILVLNTGTKKEDVISMATRVLEEYGEKSLSSLKDVKTLSQDLDIPPVKASQIIACAELGRRFFAKNVHGVPVIRTPQDVFEYVLDMRGLSKEHLRGLYLNSHHRIIHDEIISIGTIDSNLIHPREVFKPALEYSAVAMILVHNHPSGVTSPSDADIAITKQLKESGKLLGVDLLDHIIVTKDSFESIQI